MQGRVCPTQGATRVTSGRIVPQETRGPCVEHTTRRHCTEHPERDWRFRWSLSLSLSLCPSRTHAHTKPTKQELRKVFPGGKTTRVWFVHANSPSDSSVKRTSIRVFHTLGIASLTDRAATSNCHVAVTRRQGQQRNVCQRHSNVFDAGCVMPLLPETNASQVQQRKRRRSVLRGRVKKFCHDHTRGYPILLSLNMSNFCAMLAIFPNHWPYVN